MATMTKLRDNAHIFIVAFVVIFVAFWVVSDADIGSLMQGSQNEVGSIDGRAITYQEFNALVQQVADQRRQENEGQELDENALASIREQVWGEFITQAVIDRAVEEFGIIVTDKEINDWVRSDQPPQQIAQYFIDSTGALNRDAYNQFLTNPGAENQQALLQIEAQLRSELIRTKLTTLLTSTMFVTDDELKMKYMEQNMQMAANYISFDPRTFAAKDTGAPSQEEFEAFYNKNKEDYKREESRKMKFVIFADRASEDDTVAVMRELDRVAKEAREGGDFIELIGLYSSTPYNDQWETLEQLPPDVVDLVASEPVGAIVGPVATDRGATIYKILDAREGSQTLVRASHVLLRTDAGQDEEAQRSKALDVMQQAKAGADFSALARKYSEEPGIEESGGQLPWFGKGRMVAEFEEATMNARVGEIVGPIKTQFGYHVIRVQDKTNKEVKLGAISMLIAPSAQTRDLTFEQAQDFAYMANENGFEKEAEEAGLEVQETPEFTDQSGSFIPGIGLSMPLMKFAFEEGVGDISDVQRASSGYVVAMITEEIPAGYRKLDDELKAQFAPQIVYERQLNATMKAAEALAAGKQSLAQIASGNAALKVDSTGMFNLSAGPPQVGRDRAFMGKLLGMKEGDISKPFKGQRGVYVVQLVAKAGYNEEDFKTRRSELRNQELQQRQNEFIQTWLDGQKKDIEVVDNRHRFFR